MRDKQKEVIISSFFLLGIINGRTFLQKFFYLLNREVFNESLFDYRPYKYGPFSDDINLNITQLEKEGYVKENQIRIKGKGIAYQYELTKDGEEQAKVIFNNHLSVEERNSLLEYSKKFGSYSPTQLLRFVYEKYPEVTENSVFRK